MVALTQMKAPARKTTTFRKLLAWLCRANWGVSSRAEHVTLCFIHLLTLCSYCSLREHKRILHFHRDGTAVKKGLDELVIVIT